MVPPLSKIFIKNRHQNLTIVAIFKDKDIMFTETDKDYHYSFNKKIIGSVLKRIWKILVTLRQYLLYPFKQPWTVLIGNLQDS